MKIKDIKEVEKFIKTVDECEGEVYLKSIYGDQFNLKSKLSQYIGVAALIGEHSDDLELFCSDKNDEARFIKLFKEIDIL